MILSLYVHDFHPQIGHTKALIELLNGLTPEQKNQILKIEVVSFTTSDLNEIFNNFKCEKVFIKVPFSKLKPFLLKMIFYHVFTFIYSFLFARNKLKVGIGIASLNVDISNIQFVHEQWSPIFFQQRKMNLVSNLYKKILFQYFHWGEVYLFSKSKTKFIVIAEFIKVFLTKHFKVSPNQLFLIPSAVNINEFSISDKNESEVWNELILDYPDLKKIDRNKVVHLFVGAYDRKGLDKVLDYLSKTPGEQLIIIGKPESNSKWKFPSNLNIVRIEFTKKVKFFYEIADSFIFPTYYEPFGLVIIEAYSMGLDLIIPKENVGASEIIPELEGIYFFENTLPIPSISFKKLSKEEKILRHKERIQTLKNKSWEDSAQIFQSMLFKN